jgi:hypothetical protein
MTLAHASILVAISGWAFLVASRLWFMLVTLPRHQRRIDAYIDHAVRMYREGRCHCSGCEAFRAEMGWPP